MIEATNTSQQREIIPAGNYVARCYEMIHVGTNVENILGQDKVLNKVRITWELPTELRVFNEEKGEQPMVISKEYTLSMHEKSNLRKDLESWRGKGFTSDEAVSFDITKLLGVPCQLNIIHREASNGNTYANISSISTMMKGLSCPSQINPSFEFNYHDKFSMDAVENFPDFIKEKVKSSIEYKNKVNPEHSNITNDVHDSNSTIEETDDLPF